MIILAEPGSATKDFEHARISAIDVDFKRFTKLKSMENKMILKWLDENSKIFLTGIVNLQSYDCLRDSRQLRTSCR